MSVQLLRRSFTVDEYYRMAQAGILSEDDRVELLEGEIVEMSPIGSRHAACVRRLNRFFSRELGERAIIDVQNPIRLGERSEPQPDVVLLRPHPDLYAASHPGPADILLVVEIAETSAAVDRQVKLPMYARAGIPEVWLVNLVAEGMEVCWNPSSQGYREVQQVGRGAYVSPQAFPDLQLPVDEILG